MKLDNILSSKVEEIFFNGRSFFIKRDALLSDEFSGNKARKFYYFLKNDFPRVKKLISHGSNQSNAMYSLSVLAKLKGWEFYFVSKYLPQFLKENPSGNYKYALKNKMNFLTNINKEEFALSLVDDASIFIQEGGACSQSAFGIKILAEEIDEWAKDKDIDIFLPSGTGTTALYLSKFSKHKVYTCPCVGDSVYLKKQFSLLEEDDNFFPIILETKRKYHFGKPYFELYEIWEKLLEETKVQFDLIYDPIGWISIFENINKFKNPILYIHQGGLLGNETMRARYEYKFKRQKIEK